MNNSDPRIGTRTPGGSAPAHLADNTFKICDALLWDPAEGYFLLEYHLRRLERSAAEFKFALDVSATRDQLLEYAQHLPGQPRKVRLQLAENGAVTLTNEEVKP